MSEMALASTGELLGTLFDRIYVINLPSRADRRREMDSQLALMGLSLDTPPVELVAATRPDGPGPFPSIGARGCFLSHLDVLQRAVDAGHKSILLLEDDVDWTRAARHFTPERLKALRDTDWELLHGGLGQDGGQIPAGDLSLERLDCGQPILLAHFIGLRGDAIPMALAHLRAILTRPRGSPEGGPMHVDGAYSWLRRAHPEMASYVCVPSLARQRSSQSDIALATGLRSLPGVASALQVVRSVRKAVMRRLN